MSIIEEFLLDRELRVKQQNELLERYKGKTLITVRINYPGIEKSNYMTDEIVNIIYLHILNIHEGHIVYKNKYKSKEGIIGNFVLDLDLTTTKELMINIEEKHILGRCVDLDVYTKEDNKIISISRTELSKNPRKCFICDLDAKICSRAQSHSMEEIKEYFNDRYKKYCELENRSNKISYELSQMSLKAMISEVSTFPSFGLVSPISSGSHRDMDYYTFLDSSMAISPFMKEMAKISYSFISEEEIFNQIRAIGVKCEEEMFKATKNINTHKGMIFLMGIAISATSKAIYDNKDFSQVQEIIKVMVKDILNDFDNISKKSIDKLTHGEKLYLTYGFTGIRGQVKDGLDIIFNYIIPKYESNKLTTNDLYTQILLELMAVVEDSTIVYRHDINVLNKVKEDAINLLSIGGITTNEGRIRANELEKEYINSNISPGGCADLLAISIFLLEAKRYMKNTSK